MKKLLIAFALLGATASVYAAPASPPAETEADCVVRTTQVLLNHTNASAATAAAYAKQSCKPDSRGSK
jgi:hypothetical protein